MAKPFLIGRPAHHEKNQRLNLADAKSNKADNQHAENSASTPSQQGYAAIIGVHQIYRQPTLGDQPTLTYSLGGVSIFPLEGWS